MNTENAKILKLSPEVIGQIAAGEVVERPAAAIKELVENSMDAGASAITVDIKEGGLSYIRVVDNGSGIAANDLVMAFERHATSKLRTAQELSRVGTLGFRGEALASIAAVSRVTLVTRPRASLSGVQALNEGGVISNVREAACAEGTSITVKDIFYNVPVRRRFLKKPSAEAALVAELMMRLILSHPDISFRFTSDLKQVYFSPGDGRLDSALMSVYGVQTLRMLKPVDGSQQGIILRGFVGVGEAARGNRAHQSFFLNGRAVRSQALSQAVEEACRQRVMIGRFPLCVLYLQMPYEQVDVNVHPNKWEVRFENGEAVAQAVRDLVLDAVDEGAAQAVPPPVFAAPASPPGVPAGIVRKDPLGPGVPPLSVQEPNRAALLDWAKTAIAMQPTDAPWPPPQAPAQQAAPAAQAQPAIPPALPVQGPQAPQKEAPAPSPVPPQQVSAADFATQLAQTPVRLIGEVFRTYILFESGDSLILCDQHALHERLLFDRMMAAYHHGALAQRLLAPRAVGLSWREYGTFQQHQDILTAAGFEAEDFGEQTVRLYSLPMQLGEPMAEQALRDALDQLESTGALSDEEHTQRIIQAACKHAVKGGEKLPQAVLEGLVRDMLDGNVLPNCPHGRPIMLRLTRTELDKRFKRIQD